MQEEEEAVGESRVRLYRFSIERISNNVPFHQKFMAPERHLIVTITRIVYFFNLQYKTDYCLSEVIFTECDQEKD